MNKPYSTILQEQPKIVASPGRVELEAPVLLLLRRENIESVSGKGKGWGEGMFS